MITNRSCFNKKRGDSEEAINLYRDLLRRGGESVEVYNNLGLTYFYKEKFVLVTLEFKIISTSTSNLTSYFLLLGPNMLVEGTRHRSTLQ